MTMMSVLYAFVLAFLILNTISFYVMDHISDRLMFERTSELTPNELTLYTYLRILTGATVVGIAITVIFNLSQIIASFL